MDLDYKKISDLINKNKFNRADRLIFEFIKENDLVDTDLLSKIYFFLIRTGSEKNFLKHLKLTTVPYLPLDLNKINDMKLFCHLSILNTMGGKRIVYPYLENIETNCPIKNNFLGAIYHLNNDFDLSAKYYSSAINSTTINSINRQNIFSPIFHVTSYVNFLASKIYTFDENGFYKSLIEFNKNPSLYQNTYFQRLSTQFEILMLLMGKNHQRGERMFNEFYKEFDYNSVLYSFSYIESLCKGIIKIRNQESDTIEFFNNVGDKILNKINLVQATPIKYFSFFYFFRSLFGEQISNELLSHNDKFQLNKSFPLTPFSILSDNYEHHFPNVENVTSKLFINIMTEEFKLRAEENINIGMKKEQKVLYYLILAGEIGLTAQEIIGLVEEEHDFASLFLIKKRVKQFIHRIKNLYNLDCKCILGRYVINQSFRNQILLENHNQLKVGAEFTKEEFARFYNISDSKAFKILKKLKN